MKTATDNTTDQFAFLADEIKEIPQAEINAKAERIARWEADHAEELATAKAAYAQSDLGREDAIITHTSTEQIWQDEQTRYWFDVDGTSYCIADTNGETSLLDSDGYPIESCNDHNGIKSMLIPHYESQI